jgi:hypothetical protein
VDVIIALVFISLTLVAAGLVFFFTRLFEGDFEHGDRLSLLPLADDDGMKDVDLKTIDDKIVLKSSNEGDSGPDCGK